jgi:phage terminase large subunit-like protein
LQWAVNDTNPNVRDINQVELMGLHGMHGTGMIPADAIIKTTAKPGVPDALGTVQVKHVSGGISTVVFKTYEQGWDAFTGQAVHVIWCDEEPDVRVYAECCIRTMTTNGLIMLTFTPLKGTTELVKGFIEAYTRQEGGL